ncbi:MAG TPA: hypothetical protein VMS17_10335 [Gemmataceae bacterium]|nr:hypothetical protein [Gemmataceae bacterium]
MVEQRSDEGHDDPITPERPDEGCGPEALGPVDGYPCYSLEVLRLLED